MNQHPTPPYPSAEQPSGQPGPRQYPPAAAPLPPQGAYQGPWPSQLPSGTFPGMPTVGLPRPLTLTLAFWFLVAAAVLPLAVIPSMLDWMHGYLREAITESSVRAGRGNPGAFADQFTAVSSPIVWASAIATAAIWLLMAFGVRAGINWVRILLTVLAGLSLMGYLASAAILAVAALPAAMLFPLPAFVYVVSFTAGALYLAATVLTWLPPSSLYIAARRAARLGGGYLR